MTVLYAVQQTTAVAAAAMLQVSFVYSGYYMLTTMQMQIFIVVHMCVCVCAINKQSAA